ncbi:MAG: carboxymuconolactone decarboxylase family protein [Microthrixaceae bacterium]
MHASETEARIVPLAAPYEPDVAEALERMMPPDAPPIALFRTFARNLPMSTAMQRWGAYELGKQLSVPMRTRELVIDRVTARLGCEYEWGVHLAFFAERVGLTADELRSLTHGTPEDPCWNADERCVLRLVDALIDTATIDDDLWSELTDCFDEAQLLDLLMLTGWYHAIAFAANAARVALEPGAPRFVDVV